ncbi:hypothetical protein GUJ93_ZPchr0009g344 [Zizania palustris]|uniref:Uncharacterized protein n=1 Tax=Zizania palustris TaxID=103762 RepID=A0A8J5S7B8_ZIZPA|nr:hypothetical protein GUJ93_ZPchr0009g344 [Zizania palustris]
MDHRWYRGKPSRGCRSALYGLCSRRQTIQTGSSPISTRLLRLPLDAVSDGGSQTLAISSQPPPSTKNPAHHLLPLPSTARLVLPSAGRLFRRGSLARSIESPSRRREV